MGIESLSQQHEFVPIGSPHLTHLGVGDAAIDAAVAATGRVIESMRAA